MKKSIVIFISFLSTHLSLLSQTINWEKSYGGSSIDESYSIIATSDGNYLIIGTTGSNDFDIINTYGSFDLWVLKVDSTGNTIFSKCFGGIDIEDGYDVIETIDNGYLICGVAFYDDGLVQGTHGDEDYWIVKIDSSGNFLWQKCFGGSALDKPIEIHQTDDSGFVVTGTTLSNDGDIDSLIGTYDVWVIKLNEAGSKQWTQCYGYAGHDDGQSITQLSNGKFLSLITLDGFAVPVPNGHGNYDVGVDLIDSVGNLIWRRVYGGSFYDGGIRILPASDNGFYFLAGSQSDYGDVLSNNSGTSVFWLVKCDSLGTILWEKSYGTGIANSPQDLFRTSDGGFVMCGINYSCQGFSDFLVIRLDSLGNELWTKCIGGSDEDEPASVIQDHSGNIIVTGYTRSFNGDISSNHGMDDVWIVSLSDSALLTNIDVNHFVNWNIFQENNGIYIQYYSSEKGKVKIDLYDINGKIINENIFDQNPGENKYFLNNDGLSKGVYILTVTENTKRKTEKVFIF